MQVSGLTEEERRQTTGIKVLAAAYVALNHVGEGSSPSGPTEISREHFKTIVARLSES